MATGDDDDDDVHGMQRLCPARVPPVSRPCPARVRQTKASHKPTPEAMSIMNGDEDDGDEVDGDDVDVNAADDADDNVECVIVYRVGHGNDEAMLTIMMVMMLITDLTCAADNILHTIRYLEVHTYIMVVIWYIIYNGGGDILECDCM